MVISTLVVSCPVLALPWTLLRVNVPSGQFLSCSGVQEDAPGYEACGAQCCLLSPETVVRKSSVAAYQLPFPIRLHWWLKKQKNQQTKKPKSWQLGLHMLHFLVCLSVVSKMGWLNACAMPGKQIAFSQPHHRGLVFTGASFNSYCQKHQNSPLFYCTAALLSSLWEVKAESSPSGQTANCMNGKLFKSDVSKQKLTTQQPCCSGMCFPALTLQESYMELFCLVLSSFLSDQATLTFPLATNSLLRPSFKS